MNGRNIMAAVDSHALDALDQIREEKAMALAQYVDASRREAELTALTELRKAHGAQLRPIALLRKESA